jgi:integrase
MRWDQINEETRTWTIPRTTTKTKKPYIVVLMPRAIRALNERGHLRGASEWVFPSTGKTGHLVEPKKPWKRLIERAQITDFTIHDLRRTNASYQSIAGQSLQLIAKTLGHSSTSSTEIYAKLNTDAARTSLLAGDRKMKQLMAASRKKTKQRATRRGGAA